MTRKLNLIVVCLVLAQVCTGQSTKNMRCPKPEKHRGNAARRAAHLDISAGVMKPFQYKNKTGELADHYRFKSRPGAWLSLTEHIALGDRIEVFGGAELAESVQGLQFKLTEGGNSISEEHYNGSLLVRVPVGVTYWFTSGWSGSIAPMFVYNYHWSTTSSGSYSGTSPGSVTITQSRWEEESFANKTYMALALSTRVMVRKRLGLSLQWSMDFDTSPGTYSEIANSTGGTTQTYRTGVEPYLMYGTIALSYALWEQ